MKLKKRKLPKTQEIPTPNEAEGWGWGESTASRNRFSTTTSTDHSSSISSPTRTTTSWLSYIMQVFFLSNFFQILIPNLFYRWTTLCFRKIFILVKVSLLSKYGVDPNSTNTNPSYTLMCLYYLSISWTILFMLLPILCLCGYGSLLPCLRGINCTRLAHAKHFNQEIMWYQETLIFEQMSHPVRSISLSEWE